ncbi:MAG: hypothetical protein ACPGYT_00590, partial [Nitrospirales bacterium]
KAEAGDNAKTRMKKAKPTMYEEEMMTGRFMKEVLTNTYKYLSIALTSDKSILNLAWCHIRS